ncbi:MAG: phosphate ABC transporter substrate-binding protein [Erysipelotrichaceae bacterium]
MKKLICVLFVLITLLTTGCTKKNENVSTDGSTSMSKMIGMLSEGFLEETGVTVDYNATGSSSGIQAVIEGRCEIGLSSRNLKDSELQQGLKEIVVAYDGIAIIVNNENVVDDLDLDTLSKIFTGEISNWSELGGADSEIVLIGREAGSGTRDGFESITNTTDLCLYKQELLSTGDVITAVSSNPNAIGYASLASVKDTVKAVKINGVVASEATILDKTYLLQRPFVYAVKDNAELSENAQKFIDYTFSEKGKELMIAAGVVPAN